MRKRGAPEPLCDLPEQNEAEHRIFAQNANPIRLGANGLGGIHLCCGEQERTETPARLELYAIVRIVNCADTWFETFRNEAEHLDRLFRLSAPKPAASSREIPEIGERQSILSRVEFFEAESRALQTHSQTRSIREASPSRPKFLE